MNKYIAIVFLCLTVSGTSMAKIKFTKSKTKSDKVWALVKKKKGDNKKLYLMTLSERITVNKVKFNEINSIKKDSHKNYYKYRVPASIRIETRHY